MYSEFRSSEFGVLSSEFRVPSSEFGVRSFFPPSQKKKVKKDPQVQGSSGGYLPLPAISKVFGTYNERIYLSPFTKDTLIKQCF